MITLSEELVKEKVKELFSSFYSDESLSYVLDDMARQSARELQGVLEDYYTFDWFEISAENDFPLKLTLLMKILSIFKKEYSKEPAFADREMISFFKRKIEIEDSYQDKIVEYKISMYTLIYIISFFLKYKNLLNTVEDYVKNLINSIQTLKSVSDLQDWEEPWHDKSTIITSLLSRIADQLLSLKSIIAPYYEDSEWEAYEFTDPYIAKKIGGDTKWCVSSPTSGKHHFIEYKKKGNSLFALVKKDSLPRPEKYLLAFAFVRDWEDDENNDFANSEEEELAKNTTTTLAEWSKEECEKFVKEFWQEAEYVIMELVSNEKKKMPSINDALKVFDDLQKISPKKFYETFMEAFFEKMGAFFIRPVDDKLLLKTLQNNLYFIYQHTLETKLFPYLKYVEKLYTIILFFNDIYARGFLNKADLDEDTVMQILENVMKNFFKDYDIDLRYGINRKYFSIYTHELRDRENQNLKSYEETERIFNIYKKTGRYEIKAFIESLEEEKRLFQRADENLKFLEENIVDKINDEDAVNDLIKKVKENSSKMEEILSPIIRGKESYFMNHPIVKSLKLAYARGLESLLIELDLAPYYNEIKDFIKKNLLLVKNHFINNNQVDMIRNALKETRPVYPATILIIKAWTEAFNEVFSEERRNDESDSD